MAPKVVVNKCQSGERGEHAHPCQHPVGVEGCLR